MAWKWKLAQTLEYKWWQRYLKNKDSEEYLRWKKLYWEEVLKIVSPYVPAVEGLAVLDAGCGPAGIFIALEGNRTEAIDPLLDRYRELPHFKPERYPWTEFKTIPIESLKDEARFDIIFCMNAINHVKDIEACYDNLVNALKPGGYLVISTDAHRFQLLKKIFQLVPGDMLHPVQLDIREYASFLTKRLLHTVKHIRYKREAIFDYYISVARK